MMSNFPGATLSAIHEGYLVALLVICIAQLLYFLTRLSQLQTRISELERERSALREDVAELQQNHESMEIEAHYDTLTGLPNRRYFEDQLDAAIAEFVTHQRSCSLLMIDFDHFKSINDTFGHQAGDSVLQAFSAELRDFLGRSDRLSQAVCARYGGDEFSVILPCQDVPDASQFAEDLRARMMALQLVFNDRPCPLTVSIGVATTPEHTANPKRLLECADRALYQAKAAGRNRVCTPATRSDDFVVEN